MATKNVFANTANPVAKQSSTKTDSLHSAFSEWQFEGNAKEFPAQVSVACLDKISSYAISNRASCGLWEISKASVFKPVYQMVIYANSLMISEKKHTRFLWLPEIYICSF